MELIFIIFNWFLSLSLNHPSQSKSLISIEWGNKIITWLVWLQIFFIEVDKLRALILINIFNLNDLFFDSRTGFLDFSHRIAVLLFACKFDQICQVSLNRLEKRIIPHPLFSLQLFRFLCLVFKDFALLF